MKFKTFLTQIAAGAALAVAASAASADTYQFTLTGDYTASWQLDSTIFSDDPYDGQGFIVWDVTGNFPGSLSPFVDLTFYHADIGGGLQIDDFYGGFPLFV